MEGGREGGRLGGERLFGGGGESIYCLLAGEAAVLLSLESRAPVDE